MERREFEERTQLERYNAFHDGLRMLEESLRNTEDSESIIDGLLRGAAKFYGAKRASVVEADWELGIGIITYEWCADGVEHQKEMLQNLEMELFPRWKKALDLNTPIVTANMNELGTSYPDEAKFFEHFGVRSILAAPFSKRINKGFIVVDEPEHYTDDPAFLFIVSYAVVLELNEIKQQQSLLAATRASKYSDDDIRVNFFGGIEIIGPKGTLTGDDIKADQCYLLLAYLILNHKKNFSVDTLAEIICPYDELDSPYKVVNNIVYRLRRTLSVIGLDKLVIGKNGTFQINPDFNIHTDFDRFESACIQLKTEENPDMLHSLYHSAIDLYKGQLLPRFEHELWLMQLSMYYQSLYLQITKGYACKNCEEETGEANILKTPKQPVLCPGSFASAEAVAHIMTQKFVMYSPLYRMEQEFNREGLKLSRQTMANWMLNTSDTWLRPIYDVLHRNLCRETVLHGDETTLQVLKESGKAAASKSYMWLYRTSGCAKSHIVLYEYQPSRKAVHAEEFLKGFSGWLHADGYQGYHKLPENIRVVGCWAHARRKFDEALQALPKEDRKGSLAATGECYCTRLFQLEESFAELTPEKRYAKRLEQEKPVLDALLVWANEAISKTAPKSALGKALHYLLEQWPYLVRYLEDGRLELSNNRAERSIKPFVMGRKNWLFANTPAGAQSSAVIYSLIETAKENKLDPHRYLLWVLQSAPVLSQTDEFWAEKLLPANAPQECHVPQ